MFVGARERVWLCFPVCLLVVVSPLSTAGNWSVWGSVAAWTRGGRGWKVAGRVLEGAEGAGRWLLQKYKSTLNAGLGKSRFDNITECTLALNCFQASKCNASEWMKAVLEVRPA